MTSYYPSSYYTAPRPTPALSERRFSRLSTILSDANAHYSAVAAANRAARTPTHRARTRAQKLGLGLDVERAVNCPAPQVAVLPLPVIERSPTPPFLSASSRTKGKDTQLHTRGRPILRVVVPPARAQADVPITSGPYSTLSLASALGSSLQVHQPSAAAAASVLRGQNVPWRGPTSRFSLTPSDPIFLTAPRRAPEPPVVPDVPFDNYDELDMNNWELAYPRSGAADYAESSASESSCASSSSASSRSETSPASSHGPATPADADVIVKFTLINWTAPAPATAPKRKIFEREEDMMSSSAVVEKRPKYERKSWVRGRQLC
ncbi:hypothetical protein C8F04DRAFT_1275315 [Mycena alexandri]|uniref:Uncharacterized protein n=1 Tax=Mycena alexandri TaxID=1745969 RepID=A0AAD6WMU6_9AGAR|nr:hypothetical protein C8F04DRAFT_1275315 [Mycena alexandri]